jgi:hypothetical protein
MGHTPLASGVNQATVPQGSAVPLTTATPVNVTSKTLGPGTYLVWATIDFNLTNISAAVLQSGISNVSATFLSQAGGTNGGSTIGPDPNALDQTPNLAETQTVVRTIGPTALIVPVSATIYLVAELTFGSGSATVNGTLTTMLISNP